MISEVELAVRMFVDEIRVELADWMVKVEAMPVVFQVEAPAAVISMVLPEIAALPIVIVEPIVVVPTYRLRHL